MPTSTPHAALAYVTATHTTVDVNTSEFITVSSAYNSTTLCVLEGYNSTLGTWKVYQAAGAANGTFMSNDTYRVTGGTLHGRPNGTTDSNTSMRLTYQQYGHSTTSLTNSTYKAVINASVTGNSVFNIVGIVLIIGSIMTIVGLVYSYMRPRY